MEQIQFISVSPSELLDIFAIRMQEIVEAEFKRNQQSQNQPTEKKFLTRNEACEFLGISFSGLHKWVKQEKLKIYKVNNKPYFERSELEALVLGKTPK